MRIMKKTKTKKDLLKQEVKHISIKKINATKIIEAMKDMSFSARETAQAAEIYEMMLKDGSTSVILSLAGSTSAAGCMQVYVDLLKNNMIDAIVSTGASIVDMDFFEALGFKHYKGKVDIDDGLLRDNYIDRIYDTYIDENDLQNCDAVIEKIANGMNPGAYSSREFIQEMGKYLTKHSKKKDSLVETAYKMGVPIFCPAFIDSSAGFGLVVHQIKNPDDHIVIDAIKDFKELTHLKIKAGNTGLFMIGGGVPKNFVQDTVVCAEILGYKAAMHKYAVQITVADVRDGACSSSTLKEAHSWGKVSKTHEQMVFAEATTVLPLIASYAYHKKECRNRKPKRYADFLDSNPELKIKK